jgi:hypothetical protein
MPRIRPGLTGAREGRQRQRSRARQGAHGGADGRCADAHALVYVDLPPSLSSNAPLKAGMFAGGEFELGRIQR